MTTERSLGVALLVGLAVGCIDPPPYPACKYDRHCNQARGDVCVDHVCQNCRTDTDCSTRFPDAPDLRCIDFRCSVPEPEIEPPPDPNAAGGPCVEDADCPEISYCDQGACRYREG